MLFNIIKKFTLTQIACNSVYHHTILLSSVLSGITSNGMTFTPSVKKICQIARKFWKRGAQTYGHTDI